MLLSLRRNGLTSLFKEVRVFKVFMIRRHPNVCQNCWCTKIASFENPLNLLNLKTIAFDALLGAKEPPKH